MMLSKNICSVKMSPQSQMSLLLTIYKDDSITLSFWPNIGFEFFQADLEGFFAKAKITSLPLVTIKGRPLETVVGCRKW